MKYYFGKIVICTIVVSMFLITCTGHKIYANENDTFSSQEELRELIKFSDCLYEGNYEKIQWDQFQNTLNNIKHGDIEKNSEELLSKLKQELSLLDVILDDETIYDFKDFESPFTILQGEQSTDKIETISIFEDESYRLNSIEDSNQEPMFNTVYNFAQEINNKIVSYSFKDYQNQNNSIQMFLSDSKGNGLGIEMKKKEGNCHWFYVYKTINGEKQESVSTQIRRLNSWHTISWDFVNQDDAVLYLDDRFIADSKNFNQFNSIVIKTKGNEDAKSEHIVIDELKIIEKNPITDIKIKDDKATIGYYDTYEVCKPTLLLNTEKQYDTTDLFSFSSSDNEILNVTSEGSIEGLKPGKAIVTVKSTSGANDSIEVIVKDYKSESMFITDATYVDVAAIDQPGINVKKIDRVELEPNESIVLNAVISPREVTERNVIWNSSNESVAEVKNGLVTTKSLGEAIITATTKDTGLKDVCKIIVKKDTHVYGKEIFISKDGNDILGNGTIQSPFATISRAKKEIRNLDKLPDGGVVVYLREGVYTLLKGITFNEEDTGTRECPIKYSAYKDEEVIIRGCCDLNTEEFKLIPEGKMKDRLKEEVKDKVYVMNLSKYGINSYRPLQYKGHSIGNLPWLQQEGKNISKPYYSIIFDKNQMTLSRWPNNDFDKIKEVIHEGAKPRMWLDDIYGRSDWIPPDKRDKDDVFKIKCSATREQLSKWNNSIDPLNGGAWMLGYWKNNFSDQSVPIRSIKNDVIEADEPSSYGVSRNQRFYVYNLIEELDSPGEWYLDQKTYDLYFYPPKGVDLHEKHSMQIPLLEDTMFTFNSCDYIMIKDIDMEVMQGNTIEINGGKYNRIKNCNIKDVNGRVGSIKPIIENGVVKERPYNNGFTNCNIENINSGISINGGDVKTLERGYNFVEGCLIKNFGLKTKTYNPAISLGGVGDRVSFCEITENDHNALMFSGNENLIEFTEFYDVVRTSDDQAAIYCGRNTITRGTVIRNNYFHDIIGHNGGAGRAGIYLDDQFAGTTIIDNVFKNTSQGIIIGGGRDNTVLGNTFINEEHGICSAIGGYIYLDDWIVNKMGGIDLNSKCDIPWNDENGPYNRFKHLSYIANDNGKHGKYCRIIDNKYINVAKNLWTKDWKLGTHDFQYNMLHDWYYEKNNIVVSE